MEQATQNPSPPALKPDWVSELEIKFANAIGGLHSRMTQVENRMASAAPAVDMAATVAETMAPQTAPIIERVRALEQFGADLIASFENHFGQGKVALPPAPTPAA